MSENRKQILELLANGKVTADEAERLILALESDAPKAGSGAAAAGSGTKAKAKYLRVIVESTEGGSAPTKVNIRIPMQLLRAGVKLASLIPVQAQTHVNQALHDSGVMIDVTQIKAENLEELVENLSDLSVDVDETNSKVRVFCE
jgi:hypothetical protein